MMHDGCDRSKGEYGNGEHGNEKSIRDVWIMQMVCKFSPLPCRAEARSDRGGEHIVAQPL